MKDYGYGWEKLHSAMLCLAGHGDQRSRLVRALHSAFTLMRHPDENHLPPEEQAELEQFREKMTSVEAKGDKVQATVNSLTDEEVSQAVERIIHFYGTVCRYQEPL